MVLYPSDPDWGHFFPSFQAVSRPVLSAVFDKFFSFLALPVGIPPSGPKDNPAGCLKES